MSKSIGQSWFWELVKSLTPLPSVSCGNFFCIALYACKLFICLNYAFIEALCSRIAIFMNRIVSEECSFQIRFWHIDGVPHIAVFFSENINFIAWIIQLVKIGVTVVVRFFLFYLLEKFCHFLLADFGLKFENGWWRFHYVTSHNFVATFLSFATTPLVNGPLLWLLWHFITRQTDPCQVIGVCFFIGGGCHNCE